MSGNRFQRAAELEVLDRSANHLGWSALDGNAPGRRSFGWDVKLLGPDRPLLISVKSKEKYASFEIGKSFRKYPADVYAFVDVSVPRPWPIWLVGARTVERLAMVRHREYQLSWDPPRDPDSLGSWSPKISRRLLRQLVRGPENWDFLLTRNVESRPPVTPELEAIAAEDGWPKNPERRR
jgi:hypothetical protein